MNKSGESEHPCLVADLKENTFSFSLLSQVLTVALPLMDFILLRYVPSVPRLLRVVISGWWFITNAFFFFLRLPI